MKEKLTLEQQLNKRKYKQPSRLFWWFLTWFVLKPFLARPMKIKINVKDDINKCKTGAFVVYNHQSRADYTWLVQAMYPRRANFVVGYNEFFRSHLALISKLMHFIPKKNFTTDVASIKAMSTIIKDNGVVCIAPEGMSSITGHNQPVASGTGKLFKHFNVPVYCCKSKGGYLFNHKVCLDNRYGKIDAEFYLLFTPEQLKELTPKEIEDKLNEALWQDDYVWQQQEHTYWKTKMGIATHLHDICFKCPSCLEEFKMDSHDDILECKNCGNGTHINNYYEMLPYDKKSVIIDTPSHWVDWERKCVYEEIQDPNYEFKEHVKLGKLPDYKYLKNVTSEICGEGEITINHQGFYYKGTKDNEPFEFYLNWKTLPTTGMVTTVEFFAVYSDGKFYDLYPERPCAMKVVLLVEEMHRLHGGDWLNFPWMNTYDHDLEPKPLAPYKEENGN